jgi:hypothetical protein
MLEQAIGLSIKTHSQRRETLSNLQVRTTSLFIGLLEYIHFTAWNHQHATAS